MTDVRGDYSRRGKACPRRKQGTLVAGMRDQIGGRLPIVGKSFLLTKGRVPTGRESLRVPPDAYSSLGNAFPRRAEVGKEGGKLPVDEGNDAEICISSYTAST
jgi:hypothetical protein